jgi:potassium efflux system protein
MTLPALIAPGGLAFTAIAAAPPRNMKTLILRAFIDDLDHRLATITDLHKAIYQKFQQAGIGIAFPQRDLHLDSREPLRVTLEGVRPTLPGPRLDDG